MVLSAEIGNSSEALQRSLYEMLLCYNLMWRDTGGIKVGLAGPQGTLIISTGIGVDGLILNDLQNKLANFVKITRSWQAYILNPVDAEELLPGMMRDNFHMHA